MPSLGSLSLYEMRFASRVSEIEAAQRLRYSVFNIEMGVGLAQSTEDELDRDEFDAVCDHLLVFEKSSGHVVGTYRMQTGARAAKAFGYYSQREFDFAPFEDQRDSILELGRACVEKGHRSFAVIGMLWRGIVEYATANGCRYLLGCSSLTSQNPSLGWAMYQRFERDGQLAEASWRTNPRCNFILPDAKPLADCPPPPRLLGAYLGVGARICSPPALDREFKTIVFLTMLDCLNGSPAASGRFLDRQPAG